MRHFRDVPFASQPTGPATRRMWLVALGLSLGPAVSNGIARFAYGLILPAMQADLGWSHTEAGWLGTANALGYLLGALLTLALIDRIGTRRIFVLGMLAMPLALGGSALWPGIGAQSAFRVLAGVAGAGAFIAGGAMAARLFPGDAARNGLAIALYFGGGGLGMILSGAGLPLLIAAEGVAAWPRAWAALAGIALGCLLPALAAARACGDGVGPRGAARVPVPLAPMAMMIGAYFGFSVGYIVYLTFLVAMMQGAGATPGFVAAVWSLMGLGVMLSPLLWRRPMARSRAGGALAAANAATGLATLLPLWLPGSAALLVGSAALFGLSFFMAPASVTAFTRRNLPEAMWGRGVALFTTVFALGQTLGPVLAGAVSDLTGTLAVGMAAAGAVLLLAALLALRQPALAREEGAASSAE